MRFKVALEPEVRDTNERVLEPVLVRPCEPADELGHLLGRQVRWRGIEQHVDDAAVRIARLDLVGAELVAAALALVSLAVAQHVAVELEDQRFADRHVGEALEDSRKHFEIAGNAC